MSGRTAKRLRGWLYELRHKLGDHTRGHSATKRQLARAWAALSGRDRGLVAAAGWRPVRAAERLFEGVPVAQRAAAKERTGKRGGTGLLRGRPRTGGPARHPGRAWLRARRERLAAGRAEAHR